MTAELRALLAALTEGCEPGPWRADHPAFDYSPNVELVNAAGDSSFPSVDDVATLVNALPALLDRIERLEADAARLLATLDAQTIDHERLAGLLCQTQHISEPEHDLTDRGIRLSHAPRAKAILDIIAAEYAKEEA